MVAPGDAEDWRHRERWDLESSALWTDVVEWGWRSGLPHLELPEGEEAEEFEAILRSMIRLVRASLRTASLSQLKSMFWWQFGARGEHGSEETVGFLHDDKVQLSARLSQLQSDLHPPGPRDRRLISWMNLQMALCLYESTVRDGIIFINALLRTLAPHQKNRGIWNEAFDGRGKGLYVDYFASILEEFADLLDDAEVHEPLEAADLSELRDLAGDLIENDDESERGQLPDHPEIKFIRDQVAHGKFFISPDGHVHFSLHSHNLVNVSSKQDHPSKPHPYAFHTISHKTTEEMMRTVNGFAVVLSAVYEEFRSSVAVAPSAEIEEIDPELIESAKEALPYVGPDKKREAKREAKEESPDISVEFDVEVQDSEEEETKEE